MTGQRILCSSAVWSMTATAGTKRASDSTLLRADSAMNQSTNPGSTWLKSMRSAMVSRKNAARPFEPILASHPL